MSAAPKRRRLGADLLGDTAPVSPKADQAEETKPAAPRRQPRGLPPAGPGASKYTVLVPADEAATWDDVALRARRAVGRKVDKSELVRALMLAADQDAELFARVVDVIQHGPVGAA